MLDGFWSFLQDADNRAVFSWLGGGLVVAAGGVWTAVQFLASRQTKTQQTPPKVDSDVQNGVVSASPPFDLEKLCSKLDRMSKTQKLLFREILKNDSRISAKVYSTYFKVKNRVGGAGSHMYVMSLCDITGMQRGEVIYRCKGLVASGLIEEIDLTDKAFSVEGSVIGLVNDHYSSILDRLYAAEDRLKPLIPDFFGGMKLKDEKPYYFYDIDEKPLDGVFRFKQQLFMEDGIYKFEDGKLISRVGSISP